MSTFEYIKPVDVLDVAFPLIYSRDDTEQLERQVAQLRTLLEAIVCSLPQKELLKVYEYINGDDSHHIERLRQEGVRFVAREEP